MRPRYVLARLAGAQPELLASAPADRIRHTAMGGVLLTTAALAGVSATFALNTAVRLGIVPSVLAGIGWAVVIFNLDRMLVISMVRQTGLARNLATLVPRVALAFVIGAVVSTPLVLRIFQPEIDSELLVIQQERAMTHQQEVQERFADIGPTQRKVDELQAVASGGERPSVSEDPDVKSAQATLTTAQQAYDKAAADAQCELIGTCGTMTAGRGEAWQRAQAVADQALVTLDTAKQRLADAESAARTRIVGSVTSNQAAAQAELTTLVPQLRARIEARDAELAKGHAVEGENSGLLVRLEALDRLTASQPTMRAANWALLALFMAIELLPVVVKLLLLIGRESHYDRLQATQERRLEQDFTGDANRGREQSAIRDAVVMQLEQDRAAAQVAAGRQANALLVDTQAQIARRAIEVWGEVARDRNEEELVRWRDSQVRPSVVLPLPEHGFRVADHGTPAGTNGHYSTVGGTGRTGPEPETGYAY